MKLADWLNIIPQWITVSVSFAALTLSALSYCETRNANTPLLDISVARDGIGGNFYATLGGIVYHAQYDALNLTKDVIVARNIQSLTALAAEYPPMIWIDGEKWDGSPHSFYPRRNYKIEFAASRRVGSSQRVDWNQSFLQDYEISNLYVEMNRTKFTDVDKWTFDPEIPDIPEYPTAAQSKIKEYFLAFLKQGYFFSGMSSLNFDLEEIEAVDDLRTQFGGPCQNYLVHLPNICVGLEVKLVTGESFIAPLEGYGMRSEKFIPLIAQAYIRKDE